MKTTALFLAITVLTIVLHRVEAEFYYNHVLPKAEELKSKNLKCVPGRTVIRIEEKSKLNDDSESDYDEDIDIRRTHMNSGLKEEYCKICVCSVEGKDEYCSGRPARNVNECIRIANIMEEFKKNIPYDHSRVLSYRIRRDYLWHNDEIPYEAKAKCKRGSSYYSNNINANDTDIDVASDIESLLDYTDSDVCFQCVCSVDGGSVSCIKRDVWICDYYRYIREPETPRDMYRQMFQQDRPVYFRQLSWRLRRTMDNGIYDFVEAVGSNSKTDKCIPFVSQYTDCTKDNLCSGCNNCLCVADGQWSCNPVKQCPTDDVLSFIDEDSIDDAMYNIETEIAKQKKKLNSKSKTPLVPRPPQRGDDLLLDEEENYGDINVDKEIINLLGRKKRSLDTHTNETSEGIKFYHTIDEINEDTLKNDNTSGTIGAKKVHNLAKISRRTGYLSSDIIPKNESLHIDFSEPNVYDSNVFDNKIDTTAHGDEKSDIVDKEEVTAIIGNQTQKQKDKELSKLIVNELKKGTELIGDKSAPIMSNVTFTPENDTLTAMAFIAGNLLNQLWNMEKDSSEASKETEDLKHEKISDLLELFKEPLNLRQEIFLKNALEHLSEAIDKDKILKNISLCDKIEESKKFLKKESNSSDEMTNKKNMTKCLQKINHKINTKESAKPKVTSEAISTINNVLNLISKFQEVHKTLNGLKHNQLSKPNDKTSKEASESQSKTKVVLTNDESDSINIFGNILEKITKLLIPSKRGKKIVKSIRNHNIFRNSDDVANKLKMIYGIEVDKSSFTDKDKIVLDYLNVVKRNPHCIFDNLQNRDAFSDVEGDILLNLSQFFKIKSFVDLLKILDSNKEHIRTDDVLTQQPESTSETTTSTTTESSANLSKTKAKLKLHLKSIIDDLNELQAAKGKASNFSIVDTLPCIYNILNGDKNDQHKLLNNGSSNTVDQISAVFNSLKKDFMSLQTRRSGTLIEPRPKSAIVWERIVKNYDRKNKQRTRRIMEYKEPKAFDDIKKMMDNIESSSKTYKKKVMIDGVSPSKRLTMLKSLHQETKKYINALESINDSLVNLKNWSVEKQNDVQDFIHNAGININLNGKVAKSLNKSKLKSKVKDDVETVNINNENKNNEKQIRKSLRMLDVTSSNVHKNVRLSRDDIINQLIKNRMQLYIKAKESKDGDFSNDINYTIAKKILNNLQMGNHNLARELYKYIVNQKKPEEDISSDRTIVSSNQNTNIQSSQMYKEPLLQFEEPRLQNQMEWSNRDSWLRKLIDLQKS